VQQGYWHTVQIGNRQDEMDSFHEEEISSSGNSAALCAVYLLEWQKPEIKYVSVEALHK